MNGYKSAIKNLKQTCANLTTRKRETRKDILALKFTEGGERRPETGRERDALWKAYQSPFRTQARAAHLAYGLLRGRSYGSMERHTQTDLLPNLILFTILAAFPTEEKALKAEWTLDRINSWLSGAEEKAAA